MIAQSRRPSSGRKKVAPSRGAIVLVRLPLVSFLFVLGGLIAAVLFVVIPSIRPPIIDHTNVDLVDMGRGIYGTECAGCHGAKLEGQQNWQTRLATGKLPAPPHDASGHTWHHSDRVLFDITKRGPAAYPSGYPTDMPAFGDRLSDKQIAAVLAFIKSSWPTEIRTRQAKANNQ